MRGDQPIAASEFLFNRDPVWLAAKTFEELENLRPVHIPLVRPFSEPEAIEAWRCGKKMSEHLANEFADWLSATQSRTSAIEENKRRLKVTLWAQSTLLAHGHNDYSEHLAQFHLTVWRLADRPTERDELETVVARTVRHLSQGCR